MPDIGKPFFVAPVDLGTVAVSSEVAGYPAIHLNQHKAIGLTWRATAVASQWIRGQFASTQQIDFAAVIAANATSGTQIRVRLGTSQAQVDGTAPYDSGTVPFISTTPAATPADGLYHAHVVVPSVQNATWWRIDITGQATVVEASMVVLGKRLEPSHYYNSDYEQGVQDLGDMSFSRWGVPDEEPGMVWRTLDFTLAWQSEAEFESSFRPLMQRIGQREPLYCCFDSTDSSYRQARTYMGFLRKALFARGAKKARTFSQEFSLTSFI